MATKQEIYAIRTHKDIVALGGTQMHDEDIPPVPAIPPVKGNYDICPCYAEGPCRTAQRRVWVPAEREAEYVRVIHACEVLFDKYQIQCYHDPDQQANLMEHGNEKEVRDLVNILWKNPFVSGSEAFKIRGKSNRKRIRFRDNTALVKLGKGCWYSIQLTTTEP